MPKFFESPFFMVFLVATGVAIAIDIAYHESTTFQKFMNAG